METCSQGTFRLSNFLISVASFPHLCVKGRSFLYVFLQITMANPTYGAGEGKKKNEKRIGAWARACPPDSFQKALSFSLFMQSPVLGQKGRPSSHSSQELEDLSGESCWPVPSPWLSGLINIRAVNGEHKIYLKATFTTWLVPLHCVISRCHTSSQSVCLSASLSLRG